MAEGWVRGVVPEPVPVVDLDSVRRRCPETVDGGIWYQRLAARGLHYGPAFQAIQTWHGNGSEALVHLALPEAAGGEEFEHHPSLLDGALQAIVGLMDPSSGTPVPFALESLTLLQELPESCFALVSLDRGSSGGDGHFLANVLLTDEQGHALASFKNLAVRSFRMPSDGGPVSSNGSGVTKTAGVSSANPVPEPVSVAGPEAVVAAELAPRADVHTFSPVLAPFGGGWPSQPGQIQDWRFRKWRPWFWGARF